MPLPNLLLFVCSAVVLPTLAASAARALQLMLFGELGALLGKLGIRERCEPLLEEEELTDIALIRSMGAFTVPNLMEIGFTNEDAQALASAVATDGGDASDTESDDGPTMQENEVAATESDDGPTMEENEVAATSTQPAVPAAPPAPSAPQPVAPAQRGAKGVATGAASRGQLDYSKWDNFDSDDDENDRPEAKAVRQEYEVVVQGIKVRDKPSLQGEVLDYRQQGERLTTDRLTSDGWVRLAAKVTPNRHIKGARRESSAPK